MNLHAKLLQRRIVFLTITLFAGKMQFQKPSLAPATMP